MKQVLLKRGSRFARRVPFYVSADAIVVVPCSGIHAVATSVATTAPGVTTVAVAAAATAIVEGVGTFASLWRCTAVRFRFVE